MLLGDRRVHLSPRDPVLATGLAHDELVLRRTARVHARVHDERAPFGDLPVAALERVHVELGDGRVPVHLACRLDAVPRQRAPARNGGDHRKRPHRRRPRETPKRLMLRAPGRTEELRAVGRRCDRRFDEVFPRRERRRNGRRGRRAPRTSRPRRCGRGRGRRSGPRPRRSRADARSRSSSAPPTAARAPPGRAARSACRATTSPRRARAPAGSGGSSARSRSAASRRPRSGSRARRRRCRSPRAGVAISSWICAARAASSISSSVASGFAKRRFSRTVAWKRYVSCETTPTVAASDSNVRSRTSTPSIETRALASRRRAARRGRRRSSSPSPSRRRAPSSSPAATANETSWSVQAASS